MMMNARPHAERGFTIVELLVVLGLLSLVMAAIYSLYIAHQRTAFTEEEVVDVQQNLRIAIDSISRDIRVSGIMIPKDDVGMPNPGAVYNNNVPVGFYEDNGGAPQPLPPPDNINSDTITLNMTSAAGSYARISADLTSLVIPGTDIVFSVDNVGYYSVDTPRQTARVFNSASYTEPVDTLYTVEAVGETAAACGAIPFPCMTLRPQGGTGASVLFQEGFMIARVDAGAPRPNTVMYSLVACPAGLNGPLCLERNANGTAQVIASNIAGLQFRYLLDNTTEIDAPADLELIRAVRVTITGQTEDTVALSGNQTKTRQLTTVVKIRNRYGY